MPTRVYYQHLKTTLRAPIRRTHAHGVFMSAASHRVDHGHVTSMPISSEFTNRQLPKHSLADMRALAARPVCLLHTATAVGSWAEASARPLCGTADQFQYKSALFNSIQSPPPQLRGEANCTKTYSRPTRCQQPSNGQDSKPPRPVWLMLTVT